LPDHDALGMNGMAFFTDDDYFTGPLLTNGMVRAAEGALGFRLPKAYLDLLLERNGGTHRCASVIR
jgi:hypothetical protein